MLKKLTLNKDFINKAVKFMSVIMFAFILLIMFFVDTRVEYNYRNDVKLNNYIFFLVAFLIIGILFALKKLLKNKQDKVQKIISKIESKSTLIIVILFILLIIFQALMIRNLYFETKWDLEHVIGTLRNFLETGVFDNHAYIGTYPYFSIYPNNLFLANVFCLIGKMVMIFFQEKYVYGALVIIGTILVDIAGILTVKTIGNFTDKKIFKIIGMIGFMAFIGVSPWLLVPYSDTYSIMFPIAVLYNYTKKDKKLYNYLLIGLCSYLGYLIKPTVIIVLIAIAIIEAFRLLTKIKIKENRIQRAKKVVKNIIFVLIGMVLVFLLKFGLSKVTNYEPEKKYEISFYHYLMMGINEETTGAYNGDDVVNSISQNSYEERISYNKQVFLERLKSMSAKDLAEFYTKKILVNYNDGTLAWGREGGFYDIVNNKDDRLANIMKNFYYNDGSLFYIFTDIMQFIWIFILVFVFICAILNKFDKNISVVFLSLIGLTLFTLLFEARARYLYLYSTFYVIIAVLGIEALLYRKSKREEIKRIEGPEKMKEEKLENNENKTEKIKLKDVDFKNINMKTIKGLCLEYKDLILYVIFGALTTVVNLGSFFVLNTLLNIDENVSNFIAIVLAVLVAYFTNKDMVFHSEAETGKEKFVEFCKFMLGRAFTMVIEFVGGIVLFKLPIPHIITKAALTVIVIILNFFISKFFAFKTKKKDEDLVEE